MTEYEDPDFRASKYPPNPAEVTYWIDLSTDHSGNVIRTYNPTEKRWIPLNRDYNKDQWQHLSELVTALGFEWDRVDEDVIELPEFEGNYFTGGENLKSIIQTGDTKVKAAIDAEKDRAEKKEQELGEQITQETINRTAIDTQQKTRIDGLDTKYTELKRSYDTLQASYTALQKEVASLKERIPAAEAQASDKQFDDLGLG